MANIIAWSKWPEKYVWDLPIGKANWYQMHAMRDAGNDIDFIDEDEKRFMESLPPNFKHSNN